MQVAFVFAVIIAIHVWYHQQPECNLRGSQCEQTEVDNTQPKE